jgi:hypothetical protein
MTANIDALKNLDKAKPDAKALTEIANQFERIAAAEPKEWLPKYYAAYSNVTLGFVVPSLEEKDKYLDKADALLKEAETLAGKPNDEILVMRAFQSQIHLAADAMNRWQTDGEKFAGYISSAKTVNAENPRICFLHRKNTEAVRKLPNQCWKKRHKNSHRSSPKVAYILIGEKWKLN